MTARTIRLFLSSTFRDFGEERDLLVKRVFPALRAKLKDRFVELVDVDLRWGITAEEAERGEVLPILGEKYYSIDLLKEGVSVHRRALRLAQKLHGEVSHEASVCVHRLAICLKELGRTTEAKNFFRLENELGARLAPSK